MRISEVASSTGVPATTLRYYERIGLLRPDRLGNGYRSYDDRALGRLAFIQAATRLQVPLLEIAQLLLVVDGDTCTQVRESLRPVLQQRLAEVDTRLADLQALKAQLLTADRRAAACPDSRDACQSECILCNHDRHLTPGTGRPRLARKAVTTPPSHHPGTGVPAQPGGRPRATRSAGPSRVASQSSPHPTG